MSEHEGIDMMSFTGSTRAGIDVARRAAATVKRVSQELGGKSPNIILDDADLAEAVPAGVHAAFLNAGQTCNAPTRMIVPKSKMREATEIAKTVADAIVVGDPRHAKTNIGPVVSRTQWDKIQGLIRKGVDEGATLITGGPGLPQSLNRGYYVRPTVFSDVTNTMSIAREEIFGPVLSIIGARDEREAISIANDTPYGLAGYVYSGSLERARRVGAQIRANLNGAANELLAPFGGYKQSGNGREWGKFGLEDVLEIKAIAEPAAAPA
jgi:aldehyde dehydrogenase (NAD+)